LLARDFGRSGSISPVVERGEINTYRYPNMP